MNPVDEQYQRLIRRAVQLYASSAPADAIVGELVKAKQAITEHNLALNRADGVLNSIALSVAPDLDWKYDQFAGWSVSARRPNTASGGDRKARILNLAGKMAQEAGGRVRTRDVAERLRAEGDASPIADIATSVGNFLSRADGWRRVGSGEYEYAVVEGRTGES